MGRWAGARGLRAQVLVALIEFLRCHGGGGGVRTLTSLVRVGSPKSLIQPILLTVLGQSSDWPSEVDVPLPNLRCCGRLLAVLVVRRRPLCCLLPCTGVRSGVGANDETFPLLAAALRRQAAH